MLMSLLLLAGSMLADVECHPLGRVDSEGCSPPSFRRNPRNRNLVTAAEWSSDFTVESTIMPNSTPQATGADEVQILSNFKAGLTGDPLGILRSWRSNDSSPCHWKGVRCALRHGSSHVLVIHLRSLGLVGTISPSLGGLTFLKHLDLSNNSLGGSIPASLGNCLQMSYLALDENLLGGEIPSQLGNLIGLRTLNLSSNFLKGVIPVSIENCSLLSYLSLGQNNLTGDIPPNLDRVVNLMVVSLEYNSLSGFIPESLGNCTYLVELHLDSNYDLVGNIPAQLENLRQLELLTVAENNLAGTFPSWMGNLTALVALDLSFNSFTGDLPDFFGEMKNLTSVNFRANDFTGNFPLSLTNCSSLVYLSVMQNFLSGVIPPEVGRLHKLEQLFASDNVFSTHVPSSLSNCSSLTRLRLGEAPLFPPTESNQTVPSWLSTMVNLQYIGLYNLGLQGEIPPELGTLPNLYYLALYGNNLIGKIPASLGNCTNMMKLQLDSNFLTGPIPTELGSLVKMIFFFFYYNYLTGPLPTFFANFTELQYFEVHLNNLEGPIHTDFGSLSKLVKIRLYNNSFTGPIPVSLSTCSNLQALEVYSNQFDGPIPPSLSNLSSLGRLDVSNNLLQGGIPVDLVRCKIMYLLDMSGNLLDGTIPPEIFQLRYLQNFKVSRNLLSGAIPSSLGGSQSLLSLDLSYNSFKGSLPIEAFGNLSLSLNNLVLSNNLLSGPLPTQLSLLENVVTMDLSVNNFSGSVPADISRCTSLQYLDLSFNNLTGPIPGTLGELLQLSHFNVSYNHLEGPIPIFGPLESNISASSFLGNSGLCGNILSTPCPPARPPGLQSRHGNSCHGFRCNTVWIPVASVAGAAIVLITFIVLALLQRRPHRVRSLRKQQQNPKDKLVMVFSNFVKLEEKDIRETISNEENIIGEGGMSVVYKGRLPGGEVFAAKILWMQPEANIEEQKRLAIEHLREVQMLANVQHRNIVRVYGYISAQDLKAIILEYVPQGTLHTHLYSSGEVSALTWAVRLNIALGVAEGLVYLHDYFHEPIIHRDMKPSNILLDQNLEPKVSDFGISKFVSPSGMSGEATASALCGTTGYMPPEYATSPVVSTKGDVYSFGMTLLELVTRKRPTDWNSFEGSETLVRWILKFQEQPSVLLDPAILPDESRADSRVELDQINLLVKVGLMCTDRAPQNRPRMSGVLSMLNQIKRAGATAPANYPTVEELANETTDWPPIQIMPNSNGDLLGSRQE
ncbi:unnamed protein product [Calypogeia fissa]